MAQFLRPTGDQATGSWTTTPLWSKVEEGVASDDGTLISLGSGNANDNADFSCNTDLTDPVSSSGHWLRADWDKASGARTLNAQLELWQGVPDTGSLVATLTTVDPAGDTDYQYELSGTETDNITDYKTTIPQLFWPNGFILKVQNLQLNGHPRAVNTESNVRLVTLIPLRVK